MTTETQTETQTTTAQGVDPDFDALLGGEASDAPEEAAPAAETQKSDDQPKEEPKEDKAAEDKKEEAPKEAAPDVSGEMKRLRDGYSQTRQMQKGLWQMAKQLEEDGVLDRDQIAEKMGKTRGEVDHLLDNKPGAAPSDPDYQQELFDAFKTEIARPSVMKVLEKAYGGKDKLNELKNSFEFALNADPAIRDALSNVLPEDIVAHVFDTGSRYLEDFQSSKANKGSLLEENRALRARVKELEAKPAENKGGQPNKQEVLDEPKPAKVEKLSPAQEHARRLAG